jgi:phosphoglycerate dehydrogenase-like enzyme
MQDPAAPAEGRSSMLNLGIVGTFAASLEGAIRRNLTIPCEIVVSEEASIIPRLADIDALVTMAFTQEMGRASARLKLVQVPGAGLDRIERSAIPGGAWLANVYGHENGIAEYVIGTMLALTRDFARLDAALRNGDWQSQWAIGAPAPPVWPELTGKAIGILGYGRIGQAVARRARAFGMNVFAVRRNVRHPTEEELAFLGGPEATDEIIRRSDYVLISMPATPATVGLIDRRRLGLMKPTAFLINVARAEIVDEDALYEALAERSIAGAALDVWYRYPRAAGRAPPAARPFHELPNLLMTPHVAGWTDGMLDARAKLIAENIRRVAFGEIPLNLVDA